MEVPDRVAEQTPRVKFSLATAFFVLAVLCVLLAEYQAWGVEAISAWWFTLWPIAALVMHRTRNYIARDISLGTCTLSLLAVFIGSCQQPRVYTFDSYCRNQLKQLALGVHLHCDQNGTLPPTSHPAKDGKPGLSWRGIAAIH